MYFLKFIYIYMRRTKDMRAQDACFNSLVRAFFLKLYIKSRQHFNSLILMQLYSIQAGLQAAILYMTMCVG